MELAAGFELTVPADADELGELRRRVRDYLVALGVSEDVRARAQAAVHEACANVVRHAYGPEGGPLELRGSRQQERVEFVVNDNGTPVADPNAGQGAGLGVRLMRALADDIDIEGPGQSGTRVRLNFELRHGARGAGQLGRSR
jgi:anti-sigma regulatory factor (Ser/Thr protein kinase)